MLQLSVALLVLGVSPDVRGSSQRTVECVDHSRDTIDSPAKAPRCWAEIAHETENGRRIEGTIGELPPDLRGVPLEIPRATFKVCIGETGHVEKVLKLLSSGNSSVDAFYCGQLTRWRYKPKRVHGSVVRSVELVTVTLHR